MAVLVPAVALAVTGLVTLSQAPVYRASMGIVVGQGGGVFQPDIGEVEPLTQTMISVLESHALANAVIQNLNLQTTPEQLLEQIDVSTRPASAVLDVSFESSDRPQAMRILREIGAVFTTMVETSLGSTERADPATAVTANVFDPPHVQPDAVSPRPVRNLAFAGALGLVLGLILCFVRESLDERIRSRRDASDWFRAPVLGTLPRGLRRKVGLSGLGGDRLAALQLLRRKVQLSDPGEGSQLVVVTSALEEEGKTSVLANLGLALATAGEDVVCVEADLHRPKLEEYLGLREDSPGLLDVIERRTKLADSLQELELDSFASSANSKRFAWGRRALGRFLENGSNGARATSLSSSPSAALVASHFRVVGAGRAVSRAVDPLGSERVADLLRSYRRFARYVLVNLPPLLVVGDALPLLVTADRVIVVARQGHTTKGSAEGARATLDELEIRNVAIVLTDSDERPGYSQPHEVAPPRARETGRVS